MSYIEYTEYELEITRGEVSRNIIVTLDADVKKVDNGIGPYEYWGCKGTDVQMEIEVDDLKIFSKSNLNITERLTEEEISSVETYLIENYDDDYSV